MALDFRISKSLIFGAATGVALSASVFGGGDLFVVGENGRGELGIDKHEFVTQFRQINSGAVDVSVGDSMVQLLMSDGRLLTWGTDYSGVLGLEVGQSTIVPVEIASNVKQLLGIDLLLSGLYVGNDDAVYGYGKDGFGYNSWGIENGAASEFEAAEKLHEGVTKAQVVGGNYGVFLFEDGALMGAGNLSGIGGPFSDFNTDLHTIVGQSIVDFAASQSYLLFVDANKRLWGYGSNLLPYSPFGLSYLLTEGVESVSVSGVDGGSLFFIRTDGSLWGMGQGKSGVLGQGNTNYQWQPVKISDDAVSVYAGGDTAFFIDSEGQLWGMGDNEDGQLGLRDRENRLVPTLIRSDVVAISTNGRCTIIVDQEGDVWSAGDYSNYALGIEPPDTYKIESVNEPVLVELDVQGFAGNDGYYFDRNGWMKAIALNPESLVGDDDLPRPRVFAGEGISVFDGNTNELLVKREGACIVERVTKSNALFYRSENSSPFFATDIPADSVKAGLGANGDWYIDNEETLWYRGTLSAISETIEDYYDDADDYVEVLSGVADAAAADSLFYVTTNGDLKTFPGGIAYNTRNLNNPPQVSDGILNIDTEVVSLWRTDRTIFYIKSDDSLWGVGYNYSYAPILPSEEEYLLEPVAIDSDVKKVRSNGSMVVYQKIDGSLWISGVDPYNLGKREDPESNVLEEPIQIYSELDVLDFSVTWTNLFLLVESDPNRLFAVGEKTVRYGESFELPDLGRSDAQWHSGIPGEWEVEIGTPGAVVSVAPHEPIHYWVTYTDGEAGLVTRSFEVKLAENSFEDWARYFGIYENSKWEDGDDDEIIEYVEFGLGLDSWAKDEIFDSPTLLEDGGFAFRFKVNPFLKGGAKLEQLSAKNEWSDVTFETGDLDQYAPRGTFPFTVTPNSDDPAIFRYVVPVE